MSLVSFRWSVAPEVALDVTEEIYPEESSQPMEAFLAALSEAVWKVRQDLFDKYCRVLTHRLYHYCWAAPVLFRQPVGQPRLSIQELVAIINETKKDFDAKMDKEYTKLRTSPLSQRQLKRLPLDFNSFYENAQEEFEELKGKAQEASDKRKILDNLDETIDQLTEKLDNLVLRYQAP